MKILKLNRLAIIKSSIWNVTREGISVSIRPFIINTPQLGKIRGQQRVRVSKGMGILSMGLICLVKICESSNSDSSLSQ